MQSQADVFADRASKENIKLHYFLPDLLGIRSAYGKTFPLCIFTTMLR